MTSVDPPYLTPATKFKLRRKSRLTRSGRLEEASALARRIGIAIQKANNKHLKNIVPQAGPADLCRRVNQVIDKRTTEGDSGTQCSIPPSDVVRDLGVLLDCKLNMTQHVSSTARICFFHLRRIRQVRRCLNETC